MQISFDGLFLCKTFQNAKIYQNLKTESGTKQRFSLLQEKAVIQAVSIKLKPGFRSKGRALGIKKKSEDFNSLRPILFDYYIICSVKNWVKNKL